MARIKGKDLYLSNDDQIYFGDNQEGALWYDEGELQLNHTISGVSASAGYHLIQKQQVEDLISETIIGAAEYPRYYIEPEVSIKVNDWGQYVIHHRIIEIAGSIEFGIGGMLIII